MLLDERYLCLPPLEVVHEPIADSSDGVLTVQADNLRRLSIRKCGRDLLIGLHMLFREHLKDFEPLNFEENLLPEDVFDWPCEGFFERLERTYPMDWMPGDTGKDELEQQKATIDYQHVIQYTHHMFNGYLRRQPIEDLFETFRSCNTLLHIIPFMWRQTRVTRREYLSVVTDLFSMKYSPMIRKAKIEDQKKVVIDDSCNKPLIWRYMRGYCRARESVAEHTIKSQEQASKAKIEETQERLHREMAVHTISHSAMSYEIENLKNQIQFWNEKFKIELDKVTLQQFNLKRNLENGEAIRKAHEERLEFFRRRLVEHYEMEEEDRKRQEKLEEQRILEEAALEAETKRKRHRSKSKTPEKPKHKKRRKSKPKEEKSILTKFSETIAQREAEKKLAERKQFKEKAKEEREQAQQMEEDLQKALKYKPSRSRLHKKKTEDLEKQQKSIKKIMKRTQDK